ncbi:glycine zipper domain-containing protein [Marinobacter sp. OP 3.4]|uniref:glycine zipper domain-containing protein n=1 Tax=Marinobacter sp. OP 3.4 TaxID=3076501 RepID=UPI002E234D0D
MGRIIAGRIDVQEHAEELVSAIQGLGISRKKVSVFYVNPDGQHQLLPMGGDKDHSPGTSASGKGAWIGAGAGAAAGAAVGSIAGPVGTAAGAGVGAYTGSLAGAVGETDKTAESADKPAGGSRIADRQAGLHVAAEVSSRCRQDVVALIRQYEGEQIEDTPGRIEDGEWVDFDPTQPVNLAS